MIVLTASSIMGVCSWSHGNIYFGVVYPRSRKREPNPAIGIHICSLDLISIPIQLI